MDFSLNKEQIALREEIMRFAREMLTHDVIGDDRDNHFSREGWKKCANFGLLGLPVPCEYGGRGLDPLTAMIAFEALGYSCKDNGLIFAINNHLWACAMYILEFGSEAQKRQYLPDMCSGLLIGAHALTESGAGSDVLSMECQAVRDGDVFVLNGTKTFISNAPIADIFIVFARTGAASYMSSGLSAFIVTIDLPGVKCTKEWEKAGLRTDPMGEVHFENCRVPVENLLGTEENGYTTFMTTIEWERAFLFASQVGTMERLLEDCVRYTARRKQFGQAINSFQSISNKLADMKVRLELAKLMIYKVGWLKTQGRMALSEASIAKLFITESLIQTTMDAIQIHGARGYMTEYEIERELRDAVAGTIYGGTSEIQRRIIAELLVS
jgi:alkylation response protein AidB-like acyl-CoA dehydrogenase